MVYNWYTFYRTMFSHIQNVKDFFWHPNFSWRIDTPPVTGAKEICPSSAQERARGTLTSMESGWTQRWKGGFPWGIPKTMAFNTDMIEVWMIWCSNLNTSICWRAVYLSFFLSTYLSIYLSVYLFIHWKFLSTTWPQVLKEEPSCRLALDAKVPPKWMVYTGKDHRSKWMMTAGPPFLGPP